MQLRFWNEVNVSESEESMLRTYPAGDVSVDFCSCEAVVEVGVLSEKVALAFKTAFARKHLKGKINFISQK